MRIVFIEENKIVIKWNNFNNFNKITTNTLDPNGYDQSNHFVLFYSFNNIAKIDLNPNVPDDINSIIIESNNRSIFYNSKIEEILI